jgi:hypothetical protein
MNKNQSGSAHVVIIAVLAVTIIGALGFMFWQNIINKPTVATTSTPSPAVSTKPALKSYCTPLEKLCFDYPHDWTVTSEDVNADTDGVDERFIIKDQAGKPWLRLATGLNGIGGSCGNEDNSRVNIVKTHTTKITGSYLVNDVAKEYLVDTVYAVVSIGDDTTGRWGYNMYLNNSKVIQSVGKVDPCDIGLSVFNGKNTKITGSETAGAIKFGLYTDDTPGATYANESDVTAAFSAPDATKAYNILQSTRYE